MTQPYLDWSKRAPDPQVITTAQAYVDAVNRCARALRRQLTDEEWIEVWRRRAAGASAHSALADMGIVDPRDPDPSREGIFRDHNCSRCRNGTELSRCTTPERPGNCGYPHARND